MTSSLSHAIVVALLGAAADIAAGEVRIGTDSVRGTKHGTCHTTSFLGPADAIKDYQRRQKERFAPVDQAVLDRMRGSIRVRADVTTYKQPHCAQNSGVPEKIVLTAKDGKEPLLVIPLEAEQVNIKIPGDFTNVVNGGGSVSLEEIAKLRGRELDFHLIYSDQPAYKDIWRKGYADKILK